MRIHHTVVMVALGLVVGVGAVGGAGAGASGSSAAAVVVQRPRWSWPVRPPRLASPFTAPATPYTAGHRGIDLVAAPGTGLTAPADAVVRFAGVVVDRPVLTLDHGDGVLSSYEPVESTLAIGSPVKRDTLMGVVASGAHCDQVCVHVGVRVEGGYVNPLLFFDRVPPSILLPLSASAPSAPAALTRQEQSAPPERVPPEPLLPRRAPVPSGRRTPAE